MKQKLLIIEDDEDLCDALEELFGDEGCGVDRASEAQKALQLLKENEYDVIILDLKLPGNGFSILESVDLRARRTRLFIITGTPLKTLGDREMALLKHAEHVCIKPFAIEELLTKIREHKVCSSPGNDPHVVDR